MIDWIVIGLIAVAAVFGLFRGIISQIMALAGLVAAYYLAPAGAKTIGPFVQEHLGCSHFMAEKASVFLIGLAIYVAFRFIGFGIEKIFISHIQQARALNRIGGAALGALKGTVFVAIFFFFVTLAPREMVHAWMPKMLESKSYQLAAKYNPMGKQQVLERMRLLRARVNDPKQAKNLQKSDQLKKLLEKYDLKSALNDKNFLKSIQDGDYETLQKNEQIEKLMNDDELTELLGQLDQDPQSRK